MVLLGLLTWGLIGKGDAGLKDGKPVPSMSLETLPPGGKNSVEEYRGKWVLLNIWASWCKPCRAESPALEEFYRRHRGRIAVLGVNTRDLTGDALRFMREYDLRYPQIRDPSGEYADKLKSTGVPESFLIDPEGRLVSHYPGPFRDLKAVKEFAQPAFGGEPVERLGS
ncbi:MAG: TlpA family protein disulfide reductase [Solirubrobacterales bacterium]|nr:TlpA family protein disulfide reductase [Solirubrobacterales bacterium]